ncbi:MAG TPA: HAD hydrolase family protein, partial [Patescibacteria group bacterium]
MAYVENVPRLNIDKYYSLLSKPAAGLAFDLDGTALDSSNALPLKLKTVLDVKLRAGVPMIVATGRGIGSTDEMIVSQLSKNSLSNLYIANYNG